MLEVTETHTESDSWGKVSYEILQFCSCVSLTFVGLDQRSNGDGASDHARVVIAHVGNRAMNVA